MPFTPPWPPLDIPKCNVLSYLFPHGTSPSTKPLWLDAANPSNSLSAAQLLSWSKRLAVGLDNLGVAPQETVLVLTSNHIFVPVAYLGAAGSRRCFTGVNPVLTPDEVVYQMKASRAAVVLVHPTLLDVGVAAGKEAGIPINRVFIFAGEESPPINGVRDWRTMLASETDAESWQWDPLDGEAAAETTAVINFSSGTTGLMKGVRISHHNLVANTSQTVHVNASGIGIDALRAQRFLAFLPLYHAYSQLFTINLACKLDITTYIMQKFAFEEYLKYIQLHKPTTLHVVPPVVVMMVKRSETAKYDLSSVRNVFCGAAPMSSDLGNELMSRFNVVLTQAWGMTESTCCATIIPGRDKDVDGSVGYLLPNLEARLVDEDGGDITADNAPGEIWLRGPSIMQGYCNNAAATREALSDGWLKTGDVAVTRGGRWWIVDRKKELIKVNGNQVAPAELEAVLLEHPDVADAAVVGITLHGEELPRAYVVLRDGNKDEQARGIQEFVAARVAKHKQLAGGIAFVDEIPKLASGKIVRKLVKEWATRETQAVEGRIKARF